MSKKKLKEDNEMEDKEIAKLEKLLRIKRESKKYKQAFYDEGFDDLLDFCDVDKRKEMLKKEGMLLFSNMCIKALIKLFKTLILLNV